MQAQQCTFGKHEFKHDFYPKVELRRTTTEIGRVYHTPEGDLPSVTTFLGYALDTSMLDAWRERIGHEEAKKIATQAGKRGTSVHGIAERYLLNDPEWHRDTMPFHLSTFFSFKDHLDRAVGSIWGVEYPLWSKRLGTAGTSDLICEWYGEPAIVDFKTARRFYGEDSPQVHKYMLQAAVYGIMARDLLKINITRLVVLLSPETELKGRVISRDLRDYEHQVEQLFAEENRSRIGIPRELLTG